MNLGLASRVPEEGQRPKSANARTERETVERLLETNIQAVAVEIARAAGEFAGWLREPTVLAQLGLVLLLALVARLLGARAERRLERRARQIHGNPGLMRIVVVFLRRIRMFGLAILLWSASLVFRGATGFDADLVVAAAWLVTAWALISTLSRVIRSRILGHLFAWTAWILVILQMTGLWDTARRGLDFAAIEIGSTRLSILLILQVALTIGIALWVALTLGRIIEARLGRSEELTPSLRVLIGKLVKAALLVIAVVVAMTTLGIDLTALTVFSGALGVGLGFGLQKIVSNYLSGIIILADKSIKPGDTVSLGEKVGWVRSIRSRFVSIVTRDGVEFLIPNEDFITNRVVNWSFSDNYVRIDAEFGVSYDSDPHLVRSLAVAATSSVARVEQEPAPVCHLTGFGDSSLDFVLRFWIADPRNGLTNVRGAVYLALWDAFKEAGIKIPYPHGEVLLRSHPRESE